MPDTNWSKLNKLQLGRYAEYYAKMEFASYGFEVYTSEKTGKNESIDLKKKMTEIESYNHPLIGLYWLFIVRNK